MVGIRHSRGGVGSGAEPKLTLEQPASVGEVKKPEEGSDKKVSRKVRTRAKRPRSVRPRGKYRAG